MKKVLYFLFIPIIFISITSIIFDNKIPIYKDDLRIITQIKKHFPSNYKVVVTRGDLLGLNDDFYIAYGNHEYVDKLYAIDNPDDLMKYKNYVNYPLLKIFYLKTSSFTEFIFNLLPTNLYDWFLELKITEYYSFEPIIGDILNLEENRGKVDISVNNLKKQYKDKYSGLAVFFISDVKVQDIDGDGLDEIICYWKAFWGGSGGQKISTIHEFIDGEIKVSNGYPDFVNNYDFMSFYYSLLKYNGMLNDSKYDKLHLNWALKEYFFTFDLEENNILIDDYLDKKLSGAEIDNITLVTLKNNQMLSKKNTLYDISNNNVKKLEIDTRHTDIYSEFIKINDKYSLIESFYLHDENCHWCKHEWVVLGYLYKDGKWYSDRNINGDHFIGRLMNDSLFTIHDIDGTYNLLNIGGMEWHFINQNWTTFSSHNTSDPFGIGVKKTSEIEKYIKRISDN